MNTRPRQRVLQRINKLETEDNYNKRHKGPVSATPVFAALRDIIEAHDCAPINITEGYPDNCVTKERLDCWSGCPVAIAARALGIEEE